MRKAVASMVGGLALSGCVSGSVAPPAAPAPADATATVVPARSAALDARGPDATRELPCEDMLLDFDQGSRRLSGTLTLPARSPGTRVPGVVVVHGSGPLSRDGVMRGQLGLGFGFGLPVYARLAETLASHGFAVYRYDKRTCGGFNGCADNQYPTVPDALRETEFTTSAYQQDALAAIGALAEQDAVAPDQLFVVGHSQGGSLVPGLLAAHPGLRAGVMLAPPFHSIGTLVEQQSARVHWAFTAAGQPERAERERKLLATAAAALRRVEAGTHLGEPILGQPPGVWASWIALGQSAPAVALGLDRPLLVLGGDYDYNVAPTEIEAWSEHLGQSHVEHRVVVLPCVTHALNCISQRDPRQIEAADIGRDLAPALVREVVTFLRRATGKPKRKTAMLL